MKNLRLTTLLFICTLWICSFQTNNLLINGSFNGDPSYLGWEKVAGDQLSQTTGGKSGGYVWLNAVNSTSEPAIRQSIPGFRAGSKYVISGVYRPGQQSDTRCNCPGTNVFALDIDGREQVSFPMPVAASSWTPFSYTFTASQTTHTLQLRAQINGTQGDIDLDELSVHPAPADWFRLKSMYEDRGKE